MSKVCECHDAGERNENRRINCRGIKSLDYGFGGSSHNLVVKYNLKIDVKM
jgi:hypothetical protein